jgi:hypothetical protein
MSERRRLGSGTDGGTLAELEEVALGRARALGRPVVVAGFAASGSARVYDVHGDDLAKATLVDLGAVPIEPSRPLAEPAA